MPSTKTSIIIFSKDRTLQLKSLLLSLRELADVPEESINVIYKNAIPEISYDPLIPEFKCDFVQQTSFLENVRNIVRRKPSDYFLFMVDDLIAARPFSLERIENLMDTRTDIDSFCLRMGRNIKCEPTPEFEELGEGILCWTTKHGLGKHWNYFWELSSSLYRRPLVEEYLEKCRPDKETFPNPLEDHFYQCMPNTKQAHPLLEILNAIRFAGQTPPSKIACFETSRTFTQGVNLVADIKDDRATQFSPQELHKKMLDGFVIDFQSLADIFPNQPNAGHTHFKLTKGDK